MYLRNRLFIAGLLILFTVLSLQAQTLYWIGGSGNFNDPQHWSLSSGGNSAGTTPGQNNVVVFDDLSFSNTAQIQFSGTQTVKALLIETYKSLGFNGAATAKLVITSHLEEFLDNTSFNNNVRLVFENTSGLSGFIRTGDKAYNANATIAGGKWKVDKLILNNTNTFSVKNAKLEVNSGYIAAGNLNIENCNLIQLNSAHFKIAANATFSNCSGYSAVKSFVNGTDISGNAAPLNTSLSAGKLGSGQTNATGCIPTPTVVKPSCASSGTPICNGKIIINLPALPNACSTASAYFVDISNGCTTIPNFTALPGTYTLNSVCSCSLSYVVTIYDYDIVTNTPITYLDDHNVSVTDPGINVVADIAYPPTSSTLACFGDCTGQIIVRTTGGISPYSYTVQPPTGPAYTTTATVNSLTVTGLCAGTLSIMAVDGANCPKTFTRTFSSPPQLLANALSFTPVCNGDCNATFSISPTGGPTLSPSYTVNFSTGASSVIGTAGVAAIGGLCANATPVTATVTDKNNCTVVASTVIVQQTPIVITPTKRDIQCNSVCDGTAGVSVSGGGGAYTYLWSTSSATTSTVTGLCPSTAVGAHTVTITDVPHGCVKTQTFFINNIAPITISSTVANVTCFGASTGSAIALAAGGNTNSAYQYFWIAAPSSTVSTTNSMTARPAGTYSIRVVDANACAVNSLVTLSQPSSSIALSISAQSVNCPGASNGSIAVTASGGNGGPFSYTWSPAVAGNTSAVNGIPTGTYVVTVRDASNCLAAPISTVVVEPTTFTFATQTTSVNCKGQSTGAMTITPSGASPPFNFTLTSSAGTQTNSTGIFTNLQGSPAGVGIYTVTVGDQFFPGSCAQSTTISINQPTLTLTASISFTAPNCFGACNATLTGSTNGGGTPNYTYNWVTPTGSVANTQTLVNRCAGNYTLNVLDALGCPASNAPTVAVTQPASITISFLTNTVSCAPGQGNSSNGSITTNISGGTSPYQFTWTPLPSGTQSLTQNLTSIPAGTYQLVYTDNKLCTQPISTVAVVGATALTTNTFVTATSCATLCNGTVSVTLTGGRPTYTYSYVGSSTLNTVTSATSANFPNVCGNFTINLRDANSCTLAITNSVAIPAAYNPQITTSLVTCFGICDGRIVSAPTGGTAPYTYTLLGTPAFTQTAAAANTATFNSLCAGTYSLLIADSTPSLCPQVFTVTISQPPNSLTATANSSSATCFGLCNGSLSGGALGGSGTYTSYVWTSSSSTVTGQNLINRCANTYTLRVTDSNGCQAIASTTITQPPIIALTSSVVTNVACFGGNTGQIAVTAGGGPTTGAFSYSWSPSGQTAATATALTAQTHTVSVSKGGICTETFAIAVTQPPQIVISSTPTAVRCIGSCDGSATITVVSGGVAPFTYTLTGAPSATNSTGIFAALCSGTYAATVRDNNGCTTNTIISVGTPTSAVTISTVNTSPSCVSCTGRSTVTATGGLLPYSYVFTSSLSSTPSSPTNSLANMCPGSYTAIVTDANTCTTTAVFSINPVVIITTVNNGTTSCFGASDGTVSVVATGGTLPYTYSWTPSAQTTSIATGLASGVYTVKVTDSNSPGCEAFAQATVTPASSITLVSNVTNVTCPGVLDGAITVTASGGIGAAPYSYSWSPTGATTSSITNANFGVHTLTVTKGTCSISETYTIGSPNPPITATLTSFSPNNCVTQSNGSITVATGGGDGLNYSYAWTPNVGTGSVVTNLTAGAYVVTVTSAGCSTVFSTNLIAPLAQTLSPVSSQSVACFGGTTGVLSFSTTAPTPSFTWIPSTSSVVAGSQVTANNLAAGTYTLLLQDINSCTNSVVTTVLEAPALTVTPTQTNVLCFGDATGAASFALSGGTPAYSYTWSNSESGTGNVSAITSLTADALGTVYTATIVDGQGCSSVVNYTLTSPPSFTFATTFSNVICNGAANGSIVAIASPSTGVSYSWAAVPSTTFAGSTNSLITNLSPGIYTVTVSDGTCNAIGINTVQITEPAALAATLTINHNVTCFGGDNGEATFDVSGGNGTNTYSWTTAVSTTSVASTLTVGNYTVTVTDALGCSTFTTFAITGPAAFDATLTATNPKCAAAFNGSISTQITGGQGAINYVWAPAGIGQNPTSLSAGSGVLVYTLTMSDDSLCTVTKTVTLTDPAPIANSLTLTDPSCFGVCNGSAVATVTNAIGTPTITWLPTNTTGNSVTALCGSPASLVATVYTVNVVDANGCSVSNSFTLNSPAQITATYSAGPALCGVNNGSVTVSASGGTGVLTYSWLPTLSGNSTTQTGLGVGVYSVQISDASSCTETVLIPISASNGPTATIANSNLSCFGDANASATLSAISPTNAGILWLNPLTATTTVVNNLAAGNYSVEITNPANGCKAYYGVLVTSPSLLSVVSTSAAATCFGICDGSVSVVASGGVPGYNYLWLGPNGFTSTATTVTGICGGDYSLTLSDANSCTVQPQFSLPVLNNIIIQQPILKKDNICFGDCAGSATINVVSTTTTALTTTLSWSNGQFGDNVNNLCSGQYSVLVTDTRGCSNTFSLAINSAPDLTVTSTIDQPLCNQCNGGASVTVSGGNGPAYSYTWTGGQNTPTLGNLCAGLYQVIVSDALNCQQTKNFVINNSNGITGETISIVDEQCPGTCSGAATVTPIGGTTPISFAWINPVLSSTVNSANNLCPGVYFVQMSDANNCLRTTSLNVQSANDFTITTFPTPPSCTASPADGAIVSNVSGNTGPISYSWSPIGATTYSVANLGPGTYTLTVTQLNTGCSKSAVVTLGNLTPPQYTLSQTNADCLGLGSATVATSGTVALNYLWSTGSTNSVVTALPGGVITVTVTAGNGCVGISQTTISAIPPVILNATSQKIICRDDCNGAIILQALSGTLPYTYSLSNGSTAIKTGSLCSGSYTAIVTDSKGCMDTTVVDLVNPGLLTYSIVTANSSCATLADGSATITPLSGTKPYTYSVSSGAVTFTNNPATGLSVGDYSISLIDSSGCTAGTQTFAVIPTLTIIANAGSNVSVCPNSNVVINASLSVGGNNFVWTTVPDNFTISTSSNATVNILETTSFQLYVESAAVPGCFDTSMVNVHVFERPYLDVGTRSYSMAVYASTVIGGSPTALSSGPSLTWTPSEFLNDPNAFNPVASNTVDVTYTVSMLYGAGCMESDTVQVLIVPEIRPGNGFSPNGDGKNDYFVIDYIDQFPNNEVEIYNRWGDQLFYSKGYGQPWDGTYKGQPVPVGTYYYVIKLNHFAYKKPITGPVTVFR